MEHGCDEIHLWGCDSIFHDSVVSATGDYTKQRTVGDDRFLKNWRNVWNTKIKNANNNGVHFVVFRLTK